eukprot:gene9204-1290_t
MLNVYTVLFVIALLAFLLYFWPKYFYLGFMLHGRARQQGTIKYYNYKTEFNTINLFEDTAQKYPEREALVFEDQVYTYKQLNEAANKIANFAISKGVKEQDCVALLMKNRPEFLITWIGLLKINAIVSLINTDIKGLSLEHCLSVCGSKFLILGTECIENFETCKKSIISDVYIYNGAEPSSKVPINYKSLDEELKDEFTASTDQPPMKYRQSATTNSKAFFIFTSGTTGLPKAAILTHKRMVEIWISATIFSEVGFDDRMYVTLPLYHTSGNIIGTSPWYTGGCVILRRKFSASKCFVDIRKYNATVFLYIGELIRYVMLTEETPEDKNHNLRIAFGNGLSASVWEPFQKRFGVPRVNELYSSTEGNITLLNLGKPLACGYVPPLVQYRPFSILNPYWIVKYDDQKDEIVRDENGLCQLCDVNESGELLGRINMAKTAAAGNFAGYHNNPEASKKKIIKDVFKKGDAYFRSGDLLKRDSNGFFYFVDRIGDTYRWKGENVATGQIQNVYSKFQGIKEANVYGIPIPGMEGKCGMASIVADNLDFDGLYDFTRDNLTPYSNPYFLRIKTEFNNTGTFKYRKVDLVKEHFDINVVKDEIYFRDDKQKKYVKMTKDLFDGIMSQKVKF